MILALPLRAARTWLSVAAAVSLAEVAFAADDAVLLRYQWKAGDRHIYEVKIEADQGQEIETLSGTPGLLVQSAGPDGAKVLLSQPKLASQIKQKPNQPRVIRLRPPRVPRIGAFAGHELTLDDRGRVINERGESQLPYLLGNLSQMLVENLPEAAEKTWKRTESTAIRITSDWPPASPFRDNEKERLNAEEVTTFTVQKSTDDAVELRKEYTLKTVATIGGKPRMEFTGKGTLTFDRKKGVASKLDYAADFIVREENVERKYPITAAFRLLSAEEAKEIEAKAAAAVAAAKAPPTPEERGKLLEDLASGENTRITRALLTLSQKQPAVPDAEVAVAIVARLKEGDNNHRFLSAKALVNWATVAEVPALIKALDDSYSIVGNSAEDALARVKDDAALDALVARLEANGSRGTASRALRTAGEAAEERVIKLLAHKDWMLRSEACRILKDIGTQKSVAALEKLAASDENGVVKLTAKQALDEIQKRLKNAA